MQGLRRSQMAMKRNNARDAKAYTVIAGIALDKAMDLSGIPARPSLVLHEHRHALSEIMAKVARVVEGSVVQPLGPGGSNPSLGVGTEWHTEEALTQPTPGRVTTNTPTQSDS